MVPACNAPFAITSEMVGFGAFPFWNSYTPEGWATLVALDKVQWLADPRAAVHLGERGSARFDERGSPPNPESRPSVRAGRSGSGRRSITAL